jgi:hypothetical protein
MAFTFMNKIAAEGNQQEIDYGAVLADMEAKRDALDAAISNMKRWLGAAAPGPSSQRQTNGEIASDTFFGMGISDSIKKYLALSKGKRTTNEIVQALEKGGLTHSSKNFRNTVSTTLYREAEKPNGEITKVGEGEWGLVDWYPGLRARRQKTGVRNADQAVGEAEEVRPEGPDNIEP